MDKMLNKQRKITDKLNILNIKTKELKNILNLFSMLTSIDKVI